MKKHQLCCIGHITLDKVVTPQSTVYMPGGTAFYCSHAIRHFNDIDYTLVTAVGATEMNVVKQLRKVGIDVTALPSRHSVYFENIYGTNPDDRTQRVLAKADPFTASQLREIDAEIYHLGSLLADDFSLEVIKELSLKGLIAVDSQGYLREVRDTHVYPTDWTDKREALRYIHFLKDRFKLLDSGNYWLSETQDKPSFGWDAQCRRVCSWAKLKDKVSGKEFYFFSVHFDHIGKVARHESALIMLANIKKIAGDSPAICVGDFNGTPDSEPIQILKSDGLLLDSREISKTPPYGTVGTTNQFNLNAPMKNRIDYIFVTKGIQVNKYGNECQYGHFSSDHFPIMIEAEF